MGLCFPACFLVCKPRKLHHLPNDNGDETIQLSESEKEKPFSPMAGIREKSEDQKVSFDLNVKAKDDVVKKEKPWKDGEFDLDLNVKAKDDEVKKEKPCKDGEFDLDLNVKGNDDMVEKEKPCKDGELDLDLDDQRILVQEEFSDSLFSLSIDSRKQVVAHELGEKEVNSSVPKWGNSFFSLSNDETRQACEVEEPNPDLDRNQQPAANIKPRTNQSLQKQETQNINGSEPSSKLFIACNARTVENVKQHSASASPKQCIKAPTLGTVGSFWVYTGQIKDPRIEHTCEELPRISTQNKET